MFGTLFFWQNYFSQEISQVIFLQVSQKSSIFAAEFQKITAMRKSFILLMACLVFSATRAQTIAYPALPNEVNRLGFVYFRSRWYHRMFYWYNSDPIQARNDSGRARYE